MGSKDAEQKQGRRVGGKSNGVTIPAGDRYYKDSKMRKTDDSKLSEKELQKRMKKRLACKAWRDQKAKEKKTLGYVKKAVFKAHSGQEVTTPHGCGSHLVDYEFIKQVISNPGPCSPELLAMVFEMAVIKFQETPDGLKKIAMALRNISPVRCSVCRSIDQQDNVTIRYNAEGPFGICGKCMVITKTNAA